MKKKHLGIAMVGAAALAVSFASPASADLVTRCIGTAGAVTVPGDLVVPAGQACTLTGTTVEGKVRVQQGADLVVQDVTFRDTVVVAADGYFDATTSSIASTVTSRGFGVYLDRSELGEDVRGRADGSSFTYLHQSSVAGQVDARAGDLLLDSSRVAGQVRGIGTTFVDVIDTTVSGQLVVKDNAEGATICASEVDGNTHFSGNAGVQVGEGNLLAQCADGVNYFGGNVAISGNTVGVSVQGNIIRGNLAGTENTPAPVGSNNRVRGNSTGQFADLGAAPAARARVLAVPTTRGTDARAQVEQRRVTAVEQASQAGPAHL